MGLQSSNALPSPNEHRASAQPVPLVLAALSVYAAASRAGGEPASASRPEVERSGSPASPPRFAPAERRDMARRR